MFLEKKIIELNEKINSIPSQNHQTYQNQIDHLTEKLEKEQKLSEQLEDEIKDLRNKNSNINTKLSNKLINEGLQISGDDEDLKNLFNDFQNGIDHINDTFKKQSVQSYDLIEFTAKQTSIIENVINILNNDKKRVIEIPKILDGLKNSILYIYDRESDIHS